MGRHDATVIPLGRVCVAIKSFTVRYISFTRSCVLQRASLSTYLSRSVCFCMSVCLSVCLYIYISIYLSIYIYLERDVAPW